MKKKDELLTAVHHLTEITDRLQANTLIIQAQIDNLLTLIDFFGTHLGLKELGGLSLRDWFQKEKFDQLERILIHFEDQNPIAAALLQSFVDKRLVNDRSSDNLR